MAQTNQTSQVSNQSNENDKHNSISESPLSESPASESHKYCDVCFKNITNKNWGKHILTPTHKIKKEKALLRQQTSLGMPAPNRKETKSIKLTISEMEALKKIQGVRIIKHFGKTTLNLRIEGQPYQC